MQIFHGYGYIIKCRRVAVIQNNNKYYGFIIEAQPKILALPLNQNRGGFDFACHFTPTLFQKTTLISIKVIGSWKENEACFVVFSQ